MLSCCKTEFFLWNVRSKNDRERFKCSLCCLEGQSEVFLPFFWNQGAVVESIGKESMDQSTEGHPVTPRRREVLYVDTLKGWRTGRWHTGQSTIHTKAVLHYFLSPLVANLDDKSVNFVRRLKILFQTHLIFASLVLTPLKDLLFDWSSRSWGRRWPLNLEVAGHCCPEIDVTIEHILP